MPAGEGDKFRSVVIDVKPKRYRSKNQKEKQE
jgi:hypothetical protein